MIYFICYIRSNCMQASCYPHPPVLLMPVGSKASVITQRKYEVWSYLLVFQVFVGINGQPVLWTKTNRQHTKKTVRLSAGMDLFLYIWKR